jgi:hypothetical protein
MTKSTIALILGFAFLSAPLSTAQAESTITEQEARSIAIDAYAYGYSLITTDVTRMRTTVAFRHPMLIRLIH